MDIYWKPAVEILVLWFVIYHVMLFFENTHALQLLRGIVVLLLAYFFFRRFGFLELDWLFSKLFGISVIGILIIFQPEIRGGLARLGQRNVFGSTLKGEELSDMLKEIGRAVESLAKNKLGALIAIEKSVLLKPYAEGGVMIDALVSADIIEAIFTPNNPLHDGGLVIRSGRIAAAGCIFPLTQSRELNRIFGTRHRAALGLSEETDAAIIIVSEERQDISLVYRGMLYKDISCEDLSFKVREVLSAKDA